MTSAKRTAGLLGSSAFGMAMAAAVFGGLTAMIAGSAGPPLARIEARKIEFSFRPPVDVPAPKPDPKPVFIEIELPPGDGPLRDCADCDDDPAPRPVGHPLPFPREATRLTFGGQGFDTADPTPVVRVWPEYPPNGRGEGFVLVEFDVARSGAVANARVVDSAPHGMFERSALRAIERWRYRPAVLEGQPVERKGIRVRLRFELEKA